MIGPKSGVTKKNTDASADVELVAVRDRVDAWRRTRKKRASMPAELWQAVVALAEQRGVYPVARAMSLNHNRLRLRVLEAELAEVRSRPTLEQTSFVELRAAQVFDLPESPRTEVEMSRPDGARVSIRLDGSQTLDVGALTSAFFAVSA